MRVVVTGATGTIGSSVVRALERDPAITEVVGVARRLPSGWPGRTRWRAADVVVDPLEEVFAGAHAVVHLAWAINPSRDREHKRKVNLIGTERVLAAARAVGAATFIQASSIAVYAPGPKSEPVSEAWPATGIPGFDYSEDKVAVESILARDDAAGSMRVVSLRPCLVLKRGAAADLRRELLGPWLPTALLRRGVVAAVPDNERLVAQVIHADDVSEAVRLVLHSDIRGPLNLATDPPLTGARLAELLGARSVHVSAGLMRRAHHAAYVLRLTPSRPGWTDETLDGPIVSSERARRELGWRPRHAPEQVALELLNGMGRNDGEPTPVLSPGASGRLRIREILTGIGSGS